MRSGISLQLPTLAANVSLPAFSAARRRPCCTACVLQQSNDISCLPRRCGCRSKDGCCGTGTDGRTDARPLHRPCSAYYARAVPTTEKMLRSRWSKLPRSVDLESTVRTIYIDQVTNQSSPDGATSSSVLDTVLLQTTIGSEERTPVLLVTDRRTQGHVIVRPLSTVEYTSVVSLFHCRQWSD